jgi:four helix bundle protein
MNEQEFKNRTKQLGVRIIRMVDALPQRRSVDVIGRQILRSATSVGANYRAACRAKSPADIINKLKIVEEGADETLFWQELLVEADLVPESRLADLITETNEILAMTVASIKTLRGKETKGNSQR